jgi:hypothetical protein
MRSCRQIPARKSSTQSQSNWFRFRFSEALAKKIVIRESQACETIRAQYPLLGLTHWRSFDVIRWRYAILIDMIEEIYFALAHRIYKIRYPSGERLTLTLCSV